MTFYDEIKDYSVEDLHLIITTQQDLYTKEEMAQLKDLLDKKADEALQKELRQKALEEEKRKELERKRASLPLACPKCDGPNKRSDEACVFCGAKLDKDLLYENSLYDDELTEIKSGKATTKSFSFQYIISFLIPLVGFIMGGIMASDKDSDTSSAGKTCIIIAIISTILSFVFSLISYMFLYNYYIGIFENILNSYYTTF